MEKSEDTDKHDRVAGASSMVNLKTNKHNNKICLKCPLAISLKQSCTKIYVLKENWAIYSLILISTTLEGHLAA